LIYRVNEDIKFGGSSNSYAIVPAPMATALKNDFPEIEQVVRFWNKGGNQVKKGTQNINEMAVYTDPSIFSVFTLPMISGSPSSALTEPHSVVITEHMAKKYFDGASGGFQDVVGKVLIFNDTAQYKIHPRALPENPPRLPRVFVTRIGHFSNHFLNNLKSIVDLSD
jgi:putative ABC transport system permease protein